MSIQIKEKPVTVKCIKTKKQIGAKITMLTAYDYSTAKYVDESGTDIILVGDSLGMTVLGYENTLNVTMEEMTIFTKAVARGSKRSLIVTDMPFMSYHVSREQAVLNAGSLIQSGAQAVKIEGANEFIIDIVKHLTSCGIAVMGHLGFTPQYINSIGGYFVQGKSYENTMKLMEDAKKLEEAGAFAIVLEMIPEETAQCIKDNLNIPTIGIGAGRHCDGQVLVLDDVIGRYSDFTPKFAKKYTDMKTIMVDALKAYVLEVKNNSFPSDEHTFKLNPEENRKLADYFNK